MVNLNIGKEILEFLSRDNLINVRKKELKERIDKLFPHLNNYTHLVIEELVDVTDQKPQLIINITKGFLTNKENLTKIWDLNFTKVLKDAKPGEMLSHKAKAIAGIYELSPLFLLVTYLLSKQKAKLTPTSDPQQILKHLQILGLTAKDRNDLRVIRNAVCHRNSFEGEYLTFESDKVALFEVDQLYYKMNDLLNWNVSLIIYSLLSIPKFGVLVLFEIFFHVDKFNSQWLSYFDGVQSYFKTELEALREEKKGRSPIKKVKKVKTPEEEKIITQEIHKFILENIDLIATRWKHHVKVVADMLKELHDNISSEDERKLFMNASTWLRSKENFFIELKDDYKTSPKRYNMAIIGREELTA